MPLPAPPPPPGPSASHRPATATVLIGAVLAHPSAAAAPTSTPAPLRVILQSSGTKHFWDQTWFGPLLGVVIGAAIAAGAEFLRRRADRGRASKERKATERLARFDREYDQAEQAARLVATSAANLKALLDVHATLADIPADVAKALPVNGEGIRDEAIARQAAALGARIAAVSGTGALSATERTTLITAVRTDAASLLPALEAEATARDADLADLNNNGRAAAEREAEQLRA